MKPSISRKAGRCARAFTLVEVMVSVGLLAIMIAACYPAFVLGFANVKTTREDDRATQIVTQKLEAFRLLTYDQQLTYSSSFVEYYNPTNSQTVATNNSQGVAYYGTITINTNSTTVVTNANYSSLVRIITIGVTWTNYVNNSAPIPHTRQMQTLSAYYGLQNYLWSNGS